MAGTLAPKILIWDIENTPIIGTTWKLYDTNIIDVLQEPYMLCFAYRWYHSDDEVQVVAQTDFKRAYKRSRTDDYFVVKAAWNLFDEADIIVAHNGINFDTKKMNARFAFHGLTKPSPFREVDTLRVARKNFKFTSNKLDDLGTLLGLGQKAPSTYALWKGCMAGEADAWQKMTEYNAQDTVLLEAVYEYFKTHGWIDNHPNVNIISGNADDCPVCGANHVHLQKRGWKYTNTTKRQQYWCRACGSDSKSRTAEKGPHTWLT